MRKYLLASRAGIISAKRLSKSLGLLFHTNVHKIRPNSVIAFRYGNWETSNRILRDTETNSIRSIHRMSNKPNLWRLTGTDVIVPPYFSPTNYTSFNDFKDGERVLYFGRKKYHRAGTDIIPFSTGEDVPNGIDYVVPYMRVTREYRIHYLFGEIVKCFRKIDTGNTSDSLIRTTAFGWNFQRARFNSIKHNNKLLSTVKKAAEIVGCNFGGFDVGWSPPWNAWILFEVNSAPALNSETLKLYSERFKEVLNNGVHKSKENSFRGESINRES
ncbi:hypothetical protein LCGC14_1154230 [marine sediment metagenome]|uniref:ATP-grasp fold RimK-type domain-containing protein n=1 Tax=marine sediment metagenome TaxID=412755 RepID=A0A0F9Q044_9ZZZZ